MVAHDVGEFAESERLRSLLPPTIAGFGIHPQNVRWDTAEFLDRLAAQKRIAFIGEAGFDFFGDRPERIRNDANLDAQKKAFEFQLGLAARYGLPLVVHARKATDIILGYGTTLRRLPSVIFHGWPGRIHDAKALLRKGVSAYFSFGTPLLRSAKHAMESCSDLPLERILSETDAPWQPPYGEAWTRSEHIIAVAEKIALIRKMPAEELCDRLYENFKTAYGTRI